MITCIHRNRFAPPAKQFWGVFHTLQFKYWDFSPRTIFSGVLLIWVSYTLENILHLVLCNFVNHLSEHNPKFFRCVVLVRRQVSVGPIKKKQRSPKKGGWWKVARWFILVCLYLLWKGQHDELFTIWTKITQTRCTVQNNEIVLIWGHIS